MNTVDAIHCITPAMMPVAEIQTDFYLRNPQYQIWDPLGSYKDFVPHALQ